MQYCVVSMVMCLITANAFKKSFCGDKRTLTTKLQERRKTIPTAISKTPFPRGRQTPAGQQSISSSRTSHSKSTRKCEQLHRTPCTNVNARQQGNKIPHTTSLHTTGMNQPSLHRTSRTKYNRVSFSNESQEEEDGNQHSSVIRNPSGKVLR